MFHSICYNHLVDPTSSVSITEVAGTPSNSPATITNGEGFFASSSLKLIDVIKMDINDMITLNV